MVKPKLRSIRTPSRAKGVARGIFKNIGLKLKLPKSLPGRGTRPPRPPGRTGPPGVKPLPSGRRPPNSLDWAGKVYQGEYWTPALARKYPNGVRFTKDGFADFSPYILKKDGKVYKVVFKDGFQGRRADASAANKKLNLPKLPEGYVWHHHYDGKTLMAVPKELHGPIKHAGGIALMGGE